jgi:hypothetical protein
MGNPTMRTAFFLLVISLLGCTHTFRGPDGKTWHWCTCNDDEAMECYQQAFKACQGTFSVHATEQHPGRLPLQGAYLKLFFSCD